MENTTERIVKPVAIIGLGPSGVSAGLVLKEWGYDPDIFEVGLAGGMVNQTAEIDNYSGFMGSGMDLAMKFDKHAKDAGLHIVRSLVKSLVRLDDGIFEIATAKGVFYYKAVIVGTGTHYRQYAVPGQGEVKGRGFSRCAICDGPLYRGKDVAVIGGGNSAFEEGIYLASICNSVTLINRRDIFRAPTRVVEIYKALPNTKIMTPRVVTSCGGNGHLETLNIKDPNDENAHVETLNVNACFIYIGSDPTTSFVQIPSALDQRGFMNVNEDMDVIDVPGLFGCGDCIDTILRQVATAVGTGSKAGYSAVRYLQRKENIDE